MRSQWNSWAQRAREKKIGALRSFFQCCCRPCCWLNCLFGLQVSMLFLDFVTVYLLKCSNISCFRVTFFQFLSVSLPFPRFLARIRGYCVKSHSVYISSRWCMPAVETISTIIIYVLSLFTVSRTRQLKTLTSADKLFFLSVFYICLCGCCYIVLFSCLPSVGIFFIFHPSPNALGLPLRLISSPIPKNNANE